LTNPKILLHMKIIFFLALAFATVAFCANEEFVATCLQVHNEERAALGISSLTWSDDLAASALDWAKSMARKSKLRHSNNREHIGENIARTRSKENSLEELLGMWTDEKRYYVHKPYPRCSSSGNKGDVGHYTQMIWQETTEVGCGLATGFGRDYLVCQYNPSGNRNRKYAYDETLTQEPVNTEVKTDIKSDVIKTEEVAGPDGQPEEVTKTEETEVIKTENVQVVKPVETPVQNEVNSDPFIAQCLAEHNAERSPLGIPGLTWNEELAATALSWAKQLASRGSLSHSSGRVHIGENVSYTGTKANSLARLIGMWRDEKKYYIHKPYPNCSNSGDSGDVGHYTQMIWKDTTEVGCGLATKSGKDFLVCQYKTSGNRQGKYAY